MLLSLLLYASCISLVVPKSVSELNERHIIVLNDDATQNDIHKVMEMVEVHEGRDREAMEMDHISFLLPIVFANISKETANKLQQIKEIKHIDVDQLVSLGSITDSTVKIDLRDNAYYNLGVSTTRYNLAILNKGTNQCPDNQYNPPNDGTGVDIYILDTGINYDHIDFKYRDGRNGSRARFGGFDGISPSTEGRDCNGHGSHCAGIAGGLLSGVAKNANLYSIRTLGCDGSGTVSGIINGLDYVGQMHEMNKLKPDFIGSIASLSLGSMRYTPYNIVVNAVVERGVNVVTASGDNGVNACTVSPGSAGLNINVGAHDSPVSRGSVCLNPVRNSSNWGTCVDVVAPGDNILSVDYANNNEFLTKSGTSMACPHVSGAAALLMKSNKHLTPGQVKTQIKQLVANDIDRSAVPPNVREASKSQRLHIPSTLQ